jgi:hypothetical protein
MVSCRGRNCTGCSAGNSFQMNLDKLNKRFANGFDTDDSIHRKKGDI